MHRDSSLAIRFLLVTLLSTLASLGWAEEARSVHPNILFLLADDLGWGDLGCYGHPQIQTPHLDRLADEGTRFQQFYVSMLCSPTRTSAITGQFPSRWRVFGHFAQLAENRRRGMPDWLDPQAPSMPRSLQQAGYRTAHFGKWHLGGGSGSYRKGQLWINHPAAPPVTAYGFDVVRATFGNGPTWKHARPVDKPHELYPYDEPEWQTWSSRAIGDATLEFLDEHVRRHPGMPFLAHVWFKDPHTPLAATAAMRGPYADVEEPAQTHAAMVSFMDEQIGRILNRLDALNLRNDTLVLFASDNGAVLKRGGRNGSLRGEKWTLYEGGIRVPCIVRWPGHVPANRVDEDSVLNVCDWVPTFCHLAGARMPDGYVSDGVDASDALLGKPFQRSVPMFWHHPTGGGRSPVLAVRDGDWKLLMHADASHLELYQLNDDPAEQRNIADANPDVARALMTKLLTWQRSLPGYEAGASQRNEP